MAKLSAKAKAALKKASGLWKKTDAASGGDFVNENVEDGSYDATLTDAKLVEFSGVPVVAFEYTIEGDEADGEIVTQRCRMETAQNIGYLKRDLGKFLDDAEDVDLENDLASTLSDLKDAAPACRITVRMKDEFQNVFLNKVNMDGAGGDDDDDDDDAPAAKKKTPPKKKKAPIVEDDDDDDDDDDEAVQLEEGDEVLFTPPRGKEAKKCTITAIKKGKATLEDADGNEYPGILLEKLEPADADDDDDDDDDDAPPPKKKSHKKKPAKDEENDDEDDDDDDGNEGDVDVGSKVSVNFKGKDCEGKVTAVDEDTEKLTVKFKHDGKVVVKDFDADKVELV